MSRVGDRFRDVALTGAGVLTLAVLPFSLLRGDDENPLLYVALVAVGVGLVALGLFDHLPGGVGSAVMVVGVAAIAVYYVAMTIACLFFPDAMVGTGPRSPHSPEAARIRGFVMLGLPTVIGLVILVVSRRGGRGRD